MATSTRSAPGAPTPASSTAVTVDYYGSQVPLNQVANINTEDARTLAMAPWEQTWCPRSRRPS
jgi:ribosome recycling factor